MSLDSDVRRAEVGVRSSKDFWIIIGRFVEFDSMNCP